MKEGGPMPGRKAKKIELSEPVGEALEKRVTRHTTGQQKAQRARIILKAAEGQTHSEIAKDLNGSVDRAAWWRARGFTLAAIGWDDLRVDDRLEDWPRPVARSGVSADQLGPIEQLVGEAPEKAGRPIRQWTGRESADERMKPGIGAPISPRPAARLLKKGGSNRSGCAAIGRLNPTHRRMRTSPTLIIGIQPPRNRRRRAKGP
jgi:putative transposase